LKSILQDGQGVHKINDINLVSPMGVYDQQELLRNESKQRTMRLMGRFAVINLSREAVDYARNPTDTEYLKALGYIAKDLYLLSPKPLGVSTVLSSIGNWANTPVTEELSDAAKHGVPVNIYVGEKDPVFPLEEVKASVKETGVKVTEMPGGHSNMATTGGLKQLEFVAQRLKVK
jgi:hypothetical protein